MIAPTLRAILLMLAGVPVLLAVAIFAPSLWVLAGAWIGGVAALLLADAHLAGHVRAFSHTVTRPTLIYIDSEHGLDIRLGFTSGPLPRQVDIRADTNELFQAIKPRRLIGFVERTHTTEVALIPLRRGIGRLDTLWARWRGPLGLVEKRVGAPIALEVPIVPNIQWVKQEAIRLYSRDADFGQKTQFDSGDGSEFDALRDFTSGMDRRAIDWKQSARHRHLLAKEFRTERNHPIVFAFDTGRLMSEPLDGVPKLDRAINAALLLAYVSLRGGDKTVFFGFDARPGQVSGQMMGTRAFPQLQKLAAGLDYSTEDANYTLALSQLGARLDRRSLIILFTDFVDTISAELMIQNLGRLMQRHLVVLASFEDTSLARLTTVEPASPEDVARAVIADTLMQERELVLRRLQRLGAQVIEARPEQFGADLVSRYLEIKRRELI